MVARLALGLLLAVGVCAGPAKTRIEGIDARDFPRVTATVHAEVLAEGSTPTARDFALAEDGTAVEDFQLEVDARPVYLSLVLDESGSMRGSMPELQRAAAEFLASMDSKVHCQLVTFATQVRRHTGFLADTRPVRRAVASLEAKGATRLYDAMYEAAQELGSFPRSVRRVMVVFTDGRDERSKNGPPLSERTAKDVARAAVSHGVPLYFLGLGSHLQPKLLKRFAAITGGEAVFTKDPARLRDAFARMARSVQRTYRLRYTTPKPARDGSKRKVQVKAKRPKKGDLHFQGAYRAPQDLVAGKPSLGCEARGRVLGALDDLESYQVRAEGVTNPPPGEVSVAAVESRVDVRRSGDAQDVAVNLMGPDGGLSVRVSQDGERSVVQIGSGDGGMLVTQLGDEARVQLGTDPVGQVFSWLGAGARLEGGQCEGYRLVRPGVLQLADRGTLTYHPITFLPQSLVTLDVRTGASTTVRFRDWNVKGDVQVQVPDAPTLEVGAQRYAARVTHEALLVTGAALRTGLAAGAAGARAGMAGAQAGLAGAQAGMAGAQVGLAAGRAGLAVGQLALAYSAQVTAHSLRTAGALTRMVTSPEFLAAAKAPGENAAFWARAESDEAWATNMGEAADAYAAAMDQWATALDAQLTADAEAWEAAALGVAAAAEQLGAQAEALGAAAEADAAAIEAQAADIEARAAELETMGDDLGEMGNQLGNLGNQLGDLGNQLGNLGGDW
jgi:VWFA-related protein